MPGVREADLRPVATACGCPRCRLIVRAVRAANWLGSHSRVVRHTGRRHRAAVFTGRPATEATLPESMRRTACVDAWVRPPQGTFATAISGLDLRAVTGNVAWDWYACGANISVL
jgi:hypothetical protein